MSQGGLHLNSAQQQTSLGSSDKVHVAISLIKKSWLIQNCTMASCGRIFKSPTDEKSFVVVKGIDALLISHLCFKDVVVVELDIANDSGKRKKVVAFLTYFPNDEEGLLPPEPVIKLIKFCQKKQLPLPDKKKN